MASLVKHCCTICHDNHDISNSAVTWCTHCEVLLCEDCEKPHSKSRLSKKHKTMSAEDYNRLPTFMKEISSQCRDHKKKFELYCSFHACPCCVQCITDKHQECQILKPLSDILKQVKSSASVQLFEKDLKAVKENLDRAIKFMKTGISSINSQRTKAIEEIAHMRKSIIDYLNKLEQDILNDLASKHSKLELNMASLLRQMEQRASQINQMQSQFFIMTQYATELQMYIGLREIEKTTSQTAKYIEDLETGNHFIEQNLKVNISSSLQSILHNVKSFGGININTTSSTLQKNDGRKDQAQISFSICSGIEQIKPSLLTRLTIPNDMKRLSIYSCRILPDGKCIILDNNERQLLLFSNDGILLRRVVSFRKDPYDACFVRNNTVAIALGSANQTTLVDIEKNEIIQTIKLTHNCYGVASDGDTLVISSKGSQSTMVDLSDMSHTILDGMEVMGCISLFKGHIYGTIFYENKVCCLQRTGKPLWTFQHQDCNHPAGITLDMEGFVYTVSTGNKTIVVVSPDGKTCKTILSIGAAVRPPYAIDINRETRMMIVSRTCCHTIEDIAGWDYEYYDTASVYKIKNLISSFE